MDHSVAEALFSFSQRYLAAWQAAGYALPQDDQLSGYASPCVVRDSGQDVSWQPIVREASADFSNVEAGIELQLDSSITQFYGSQYAADMSATFGDIELLLLQVWSDEDLPQLQENILGHLVMQRQLKLKPTVFIGALATEQQLISVCNLTGEVLLETLGQAGERQVLADNLTAFLDALTPVVVEGQ
uniref:SecY-interacting protein n=1 Tax=Thaumasiovibrio occultus TaxID=1891184 RepID=UPI000B34C3E8|nr:SecY-interacting protein [Thaumasiovibrio occultus]